MPKPEEYKQAYQALKKIMNGTQNTRSLGFAVALHWDAIKDSLEKCAGVK